MRFALLRTQPSAHAEWHARARAAGLQVREPVGAFLLFCEPDLPVRVRGQAALLGEWHARDADGGEAHRDWPDTPTELLNQGWGAYLLARSDAAGDSLFRDPSGALSCYHLRCGTADLFVSDGEVAAALGALDDSGIDELFLRHWLRFPYLRSFRTGLLGVEEVIPGAVRRLLPHRTQDQALWCPALLAERRGPAGVAAAAAALRDAVLRSVDAQLTGKTLLLQLSGGLDSSILAVALAHRGIPFQAVTFASASADGDERRYAQVVADRCGVQLRVVKETASAPLTAASGLSFRPGPNLLLAPLDAAMERVRQEQGAEWLVDGGGGDNLFGFSATTAQAADALRAGRVHAIADVAGRSGSSWWTALALTLRTLFRPHDGAAWPEDRRFLAGDLPAAPDRHPWLDRLGALPPGKQEHVQSLLHIQHFLDRHVSGGRLLHPLYVQPLLELCLSFPSWLASAGGRDRAVARHAFADLLPDSVLHRRTKGSLEGLFHRRFRQHAPALRSLLLDGALARRGVIDRATVEAAFIGDRWQQGHAHVRLSEIATLELWLRAAEAELGRVRPARR